MNVKGAETKRREIIEELVGETEKSVFLVEGESKITGEVVNLNILPRFCLENYLVEPTELWDALPANQRDKIDGGFEQLSGEILVDLDKWIRHGALRTLITPLWDGLIARCFQGDLLDIHP